MASAAGVVRGLGLARGAGVARGVGLGVGAGSGVAAGVGVPEGSEKVIGGNDRVGVAAGVEDCASAAGALVTSNKASERRAGDTRVRHGTIMMRGASANAVEVNHFSRGDTSPIPSTAPIRAAGATGSFRGDRRLWRPSFIDWMAPLPYIAISSSISGHGAPSRSASYG
ncbi:hypothetical protein [Sphingomonas sp. Mn802worker]|uniref:hypothetical protein n=1 Tax=Sphingomonas sp. Mn802worker TaxID=629773 RepID=UPI0003A3EABA|nr:hypothetical protein [Sphingomonas sp. Mn802worker]